MTANKEIEALLKANKEDPGIKYVAALRSVLRLQAARGVPADNSELDSEEARLLVQIEKHIRKRLSGSKLTQQQIADIYRACVEPLGPRGLIKFFINENVCFGVPFKYFAANAVLMLLLFIFTSNFVLLLLVMPVTHAILYLVTAKEVRRRQEDRKQQILTGLDIAERKLF